MYLIPTNLSRHFSLFFTQHQSSGLENPASRKKDEFSSPKKILKTYSKSSSEFSSNTFYSAGFSGVESYFAGGEFEPVSASSLFSLRSKTTHAGACVTSFLSPRSLKMILNHFAGDKSPSLAPKDSLLLSKSNANQEEEIKAMIASAVSEFSRLGLDATKVATNGLSKDQANSLIVQQNLVSLISHPSNLSQKIWLI